MYYPTIVRKHHWFTVLNDKIYITAAVIVNLYSKTAIISMMIFVIGQLKLLQDNLMLLTGIIADEDVEIHLKDCIKEHQEIIRYVIFEKKNS